MAWSTPPTFTASTLTASQLNILSDDIEYLNGIAQTINPCMYAPRADGDTDYYFYIRHTNQYFHYRFSSKDQVGNVITWTLYYNEIQIDTNATNNSGTVQTIASYKDTDSDPGSLVVGNWYEVRVNIDWASAAAFGTYFQVDYMRELDTTS